MARCGLLLVLLLNFCLFFYHFCDPSASFPDVPKTVCKLFESFYSNILIYLVLIFLIHFLLVMLVNFMSDFRYIPYNICLNMLSKQRKIKFLSQILILKYFYLTFNFTLLMEENALASVWLENSSLDMILLHFLTNVIVLILLIFKAAHHYTVFIIRNHQKILSPCFCNPELSALWLFTLILQLSSDVHLGPGPLADQIFSNVSPQSCSQYQISAFWLFALLILLSYDIHPNPGPQHVSSEFSNGFLSFCNWNLNTLSINNFSRVSLLEAHNTIFKYDIISLCETSLNNDTSVPEGILPGYQYHPLNHPDGKKWRCRYILQRYSTT